MAKAKTTTKKTTSTKTAAKGSTAKAAKTKPSDQEVVMDRRRSDRRTKPVESAEAKEEKKGPAAAEPKLERRAKVNRRRQIDPTTCERDYSGDEIEFMQALDAYKRSSGRMFPTCSEILEVIRDLGYQKPNHQMPEPETASETAATPAFSDEVPAIDANL